MNNIKFSIERVKWTINSSWESGWKEDLQWREKLNFDAKCKLGASFKNILRELNFLTEESEYNPTN